ncbi:GDP-D-glucose phosphorylase 1 isoform X1 [Anolis sagrei]|uniref:GDP-D-glucose phosphorylase 1 isoform X1 n=2 Tax=Anolis sagrei TaxID=38937 RepID=UPI003521B457
MATRAPPLKGDALRTRGRCGRAGRKHPLVMASNGPDLNGTPSVEAFCYGKQDLLLNGVEWPSRGLSRFDHALLQGWRDRMEKGLFRYHLDALPTRILPGTMGLVAQLNVERGEQRRAPQEIHSLKQAFDPRRFNFAHIRPKEVLFALRQEGSAEEVLVVINVSPLENGHVLLVPDPGRELPQILTPEALHCGLEAVLLSAQPGFRVGFNSLGAYASVNHLHLHGYYLDRELPVETAPCQALLPRAGLYLLQERAPAPGFLFFYCKERQLEEMAGQVAKLTSFLLEKGVAHNLFVTRGAAPNEGPLSTASRPGLRIIVWPRRACFGAKESSAFNVALCELAGHLPIKTAQDFEALTEASALQTIRECLLSDDEFAQLQRELVALFR